MPLIALAYLALAGGLLAGFAAGGAAGLGLSAWGWALALALLATAGASLVSARGARTAAALPLVALAGLLLAVAERERGHGCRAAALAQRRHLVVLADAAVPGQPARARLLGGDGGGRGGCALRVSLVVREGRAPAGALATVRGAALAAGGAVDLRVPDARVVRHEAAPWLDRLRARVRDAVRRVFRAHDGLAAALLVADTRGLDPALRARFADAGLVHMLSISGLHVGIIAAAVELLARAARLRRRAALVVAVVVTAAYVALLGFPPPAVRAGAMLGVGAAARLLQRPTSPWGALAVGALVPLVHDPADVLDLGYQLSVAGIAGLAASGALARRWLHEPLPAWLPGWLPWWLRPRLRPWLRPWLVPVLRSLLASTVASAVTAPLVAWHFGRLSLVGPLANLVAGPVMALLQPLLFLALLLAPAEPLAHFVADGAAPLFRALDAVAAGAVALPGAALDVAPSLPTAALCAVAVAAGVVACVSRFPARPLLAAAVALAAAVWLPLAPRPRGALELHVLDVGQGDALALRTPAGRWVLVDAGGVWRGGDAGQRTVAPYVRRRGGAVAAFVLTHPHADHVGGATTVLRALRPARYWDAAFAAGSVPYERSLRHADSAGVAWRRVHPGDTLQLDGVLLRVLAPDSAWTVALRDPNAASTILLVEYGTVRFLLTGDAEQDEEAWLLRHAGSLRADVLKVGHHGSRTSSTPAFLAAVQPRVALVSVGAGNRYGHPSPEVLRRLVGVGAQVLRTDQLGSVVVRTDGRALTLEAAGERWALSPRGPDGSARDSPRSARR